MASIFDLFVRIQGDNSSYKQAVGESIAANDKFAGSTEAVVSRLSSAGGKMATALGFGAIGAGALAAASKFEEAGVTIARATGATGAKLDALTESFTNVYKRSAASSEAVSTTMALLSTRTGATGKALEDLTIKTLKLAKTQNEDVATIVPLVTRLFGDWSVATDRQGKAMDFLRATSQLTGTSVARLSEQVVYAGAPLRQLGYTFEQSVALIGKFEKEGVNTELVLGGMKAALQKFAKEGVTDTAGAWQKFVAGVRSGGTTLTEVLKEVGAKRGVDLFKAIQEGRFQVDALVESTGKLASQAPQNVTTLKTQFTILQHQIESVVAAHKDLIVALGLGWPAITGALGLAKKAYEALAVALAAPAVATSVAQWQQLGFGIASGTTAMNTWAGAASAAVTPARALLAVLGPIAAILAAGVGGYLLGDALQQKFAPGGNTTNYDPNQQWKVSGHGVVPRGAAPKIGQSLIDFVGNAPAKGKPTPNPGGGDVGGGTDKYRPLKDMSDELAVLTAQYHQTEQAHKETINEIAKSGLTIPQYWDDLREKAAYSALAFDDLGNAVAPQKTIFEALAPELDKADKLLKELGTDITAAAKAALNDSPFAKLADSAGYFGIKTRDEYDKTARTSQAKYQEMLGTGLASDEELTRAYLMMLEDMAAADRAFGRISDAEWRKIVDDIEAQLNRLPGAHQSSANQRRAIERTLGDDLAQSWRGAFGSLYRNLADNILKFKGWGDTIKQLGHDVASDLLSSFLKGFFKPLEDEMAKIGKKLGDLFGSIWGNKGTSSPSIPGGGSAGGGGGGAVAGASSGLMGTLTAIGSIGTMISSVIGNFQNAKQETSLNAIEHNTRYSMMYLGERADGGILGVLFKISEAVAWGPGVKALESIRDHIVDFGSAGGGKGGLTVNFYGPVNGDPNAIATAIFKEAALAGAI